MDTKFNYHLIGLAQSSQFLFVCFSSVSRSVLSSLFSFSVSFSSHFVDSVILLAHFPYIQPERRNFYCFRVFGIFFSCYIVVLPTKPNRCLMKTMTIFLGLILNFVAMEQL